MEFETMLFEEPVEGVGLVTLNRPERLNAINLAMLDDFYALFSRLERDEKVRVLVITGKGRAFCSGADLKEMRKGRHAETYYRDASTHLVYIQKRYAGVISGMRNLPQPVIAAVHGHAAGGGMCLAMASDIIYADPTAAFTPSFANIGISGGELGSSYFLPRLVGTARASEILLTGRTVYAEEAGRIGLVSRVVEEGMAGEEAVKTAELLLAKSISGLRMTKEVIRYNLNAPSLEAALELENRNQSICCFAGDFLAAVEAFRSRKKA